MHSKRHSLVALTQGADVPSTRFRWAQYTEYLSTSGFDVSEFPSYFGAYSPVSKIKRPAWLAAAILENLPRVLRSNQYDLRFVQRNLTATLLTWEPILRPPFVFDVDDAIFLGQRGASADRIARSASVIICGNSFLANYFTKHGNVEVLPTAVDTQRFKPRLLSAPVKQIIGWTGSSSGFKYLHSIEPALKIVLSKHSNAVFKVVSDKKPFFKLLPTSQVCYEPWSEDREVDVLHEFTVGIMPLENDLWARGKCSFKMLTYMASGLPVVVSPVGMNAEVLKLGMCGYAANSTTDWVEALSSLLNDSLLVDRMGAAGRNITETFFSRAVIAPKLTKLLKAQL